MLKFRWPHSAISVRMTGSPPVPVRSASWRLIGKGFQEGRQHWRSTAGLTDKEGRRANCNESGKTPLMEGSGSYHLVRAHLGDGTIETIGLKIRDDVCTPTFAYISRRLQPVFLPKSPNPWTRRTDSSPPGHEEGPTDVSLRAMHR